MRSGAILSLISALCGLFGSADATTTLGQYRHLEDVETTRCSDVADRFVLENIKNASNGCVTDAMYDWPGSADPTNTERAELCRCNVAQVNVLDCSWTKLHEGVVSVAEHVASVFDCPGKRRPIITVTSLILKSNASVTLRALSSSTSKATTSSPSEEQKNSSTSDSSINFPLSTVAEPPAPRCNDQQTLEFTNNLKAASNWCLDLTSYDWIGTVDPTDKQVEEICKCSTIANFTIPNCKIRKGTYLVGLNTHYIWVRDKCSSISTGSSNGALIGGIVGGVGVVLIIIGFVIYKRRRSQKQSNAELAGPADGYHPYDEPAVAYRAMPFVTDYNRVNQPSPRNKRTSYQRPSMGTDSSGRRTDSMGTSTGGGLGSRSGSVGRPIRRASDMVSWDDPAIAAIRIPHEAIFFGGLLSRGAFGEVFLGTYRGETVALKQLRPERRKNTKDIDSFLVEIKLMSSLEHERIVRFIGVAWNTLSDACAVVEYMANGDLRSVLTRWDEGEEQRERGFDADKIKIALHISHALVYLHSLRPMVLHRDLKSKNILLTDNYDAKLTDFGISRERADSTMTANVGSVLWMAPEVMMGERYDEKADVFSFGVVLSELDTHKLPYAHARNPATGERLSDTAVLQQVMLGRLRVAFTDRADPELAQLGHECVSLDPRQRPTAAQVLHRIHQIHRRYV